MHEQTKYTAISKETKDKIYQRDNGQCIIEGCTKTNVDPAHYIGRAQGGLGIEQNLVCLCRLHHDLYDNGAYRKLIGNKIKKYLDDLYPDFSDEQRVYNKYRWLDET